jgi:hypothetical protein
MDEITTQPLIEDDRLYDENFAADYANCSRSAVRNSRNTGLLLSVPAPPFVKMGSSVRYKGRTLREWREQFPEQLPLDGMA